MELWLAQIAAIAFAIFFSAVEYVRFRSNADRPVLRASLEGFRVWGFIAFSEAAIWLGLRNPDSMIWISYGILSPILAALIFNNAYLGLHKWLLGRGA